MLMPNDDASPGHSLPRIQRRTHEIVRHEAHIAAPMLLKRVGKLLLSYAAYGERALTLYRRRFLR